jgi:hypothetical protein
MAHPASDGLVEGQCSAGLHIGEHRGYIQGGTKFIILSPLMYENQIFLITRHFY